MKLKRLLSKMGEVPCMQPSHVKNIWQVLYSHSIKPGLILSVFFFRAKKYNMCDQNLVII